MLRWRRADGSWAATRVGDFGPRQGTGKNDKIAARELAGLVLFGERLLIHTAHEFPTANESFLRMVAIFENWDDLRRRVARIRYANGEQGIEFISGQRLKYRARTGGSGRGFAKADLLVYDEAQHLAREHVAASGPAKLANPNSQTWYAGSGGLTSSAVAWALRKAALLGSGGRLAYTEKTGEQVSIVDGQVVQVVPDPEDRDVWYAAMPGLGRWVTEEAMQALYEELGPELFLRECVCVWDPEPGVEGGWQVIGRDPWLSRLDPDSQPQGPLAWALDASPDCASACIAISDGTHVEVTGDGSQYDHRPGTGWVVPRLKQLKERHRIVEIAMAHGSPAEALRPALEDAGFTIRKVTTQEHAQACGALLQAVNEGPFRHRGQPMLDAAARGAVRRDVGDVWLWARAKSTVDVCPLVAVGLARWMASQRAEVMPGYYSGSG